MSKDTVSDFSFIQATITITMIKTLLHAIRHGQSIPATPLSKMRVVRQAVPESLPKPIYDHLLIEWLASLILSKVNHQRDIHALGLVSRFASQELALNQLRQDFYLRDFYLQSWSVLYYDFIRVDLELNEKLWEERTLLSSRTLRRRRTRGYHLLLTDILLLEIRNQSGQVNN